MTTESKQRRVHIYAVVRVPVDCTASNDEEAIADALSAVNLYEVLRNYAGEIVGFGVDTLDSTGDYAPGNVLRNYASDGKTATD